MKKKYLILGNWKAYMTTTQECVKLIKNTQTPKATNIEYGIAPSLAHIFLAKQTIGKRKIALGCQDISVSSSGAHTGQDTVESLMNIGVTFCILGHSEQRALGQSNELIAQKIQTAIEHKLRPVICVGERRKEEANITLKEQVTSALKAIPKSKIRSITVAYEPVWAIGKSADEAATPEYVHSKILFIRSIVAKQIGKEYAFSFPILYGGSVKANNVASFIKVGTADGALTGSASVDQEEISSILKNTSKI